MTQNIKIVNERIRKELRVIRSLAYGMPTKEDPGLSRPGLIIGMADAIDAILKEMEKI